MTYQDNENATQHHHADDFDGWKMLTIAAVTCAAASGAGVLLAFAIVWGIGL